MYSAAKKEERRKLHFPSFSGVPFCCQLKTEKNVSHVIYPNAEYAFPHFHDSHGIIHNVTVAFGWIVRQYLKDASHSCDSKRLTHMHTHKQTHVVTYVSSHIRHGRRVSQVPAKGRRDAAISRDKTYRQLLHKVRL